MNDVTIGIVGLDNWYHALPFTELAATTPGVRLKAVSDDNATRRDWVATRYPGATVGTDHDAVLADPEIDAVLVLTPTNRHCEHAESAARHGKHLLCDKPLGTSAAAARRIVTAYAGTGLRSATIFGRRGRPLYRTARDIVAAGEIGTVLAIIETGRFGMPRAVPDDPDPGWYADPAQSGGGGFIDHAVHQIDSIRFITGAEVAGASGAIRHLTRRTKGEDYGIARLLLTTGAIATIESSWIAHGPSSSVLFIEGTAGSLRLDDATKTLTLTTKARQRTFTDQPARVLDGGAWKLGMNGYVEVFEDFVTLIRRGGHPIASLTDGLRAVETTDAVYASSAA